MMKAGPPLAGSACGIRDVATVNACVPSNNSARMVNWLSASNRSPATPIVAQGDLADVADLAGALEVAERLLVVGLRSPLRRHRGLLNFFFCFQGPLAIAGVLRVGDDVHQQVAGLRPA